MKKRKSATGDVRKTILRIFFINLYLSTFTFGGGYIIVSLFKQIFCNDLHLIDENEMTDMVAIAQSAPGSISVNGAIAVGYKLAGVPGILVSVLGIIIPSLIILTIMSGLYTIFQGNFYVQSVLRGMKAGVAALIMSVVYDMGSGIVKSKDYIHILIMVLAFIATYYLKINVLIIMLVAALIGLVRFFIKTRSNTGKKAMHDDLS